MSDPDQFIVISAEDADGQPTLCRLCLEKSMDVMDIFNIERMSEKMHNFLQIEVTAADQWPLVICPVCVSQINTWEAYYDLVRKNDEKLQSQRVEQDLGPTVLYEMDTIKGEDDQSGEATMENYTVVCIPKLEGEAAELIEEEVLLEEEEQELGEDLNRDDNYLVLEMGDDEDDVAGEVAAEEEEEDIGDLDEELDETDEIIELDLRPKPRKNKLGRPRKEKPPTTLEYLTQRDEQDELIRQTVSMDCDICFQTSATFEELLTHYKDVHGNSQGYVKCCEKTFKRRYVLLEHVKLHLNPDTYACPKCQKRFSTKRHLTDHVMLHIPEEQRQFQCEKCLKRYATSARLLVHMKTHNEELSYHCLYCDKSFRQEVIMKNHVKSVHEGSNQHICEICAKVFKTKEGFLIHQVEHLETPPERLKCEICGGKYKNKDSLKYHMLRHKRANERYYCDVCNREFTSKKRMSAHRKYVHATESQLFQCTMCDKSFKRPISLKEHMAAHTGQLLYTCSYCPKQFNSNANKYSHQKAQHPVEWELARQQKMAA